MKIHTLAELNEFLDGEFAWRRKELTGVLSDIRQADASTKPARLRGGIALLYAHWEGFVKQAGEAYLVFVATKRLRLDELNPSFLALALRAKLGEFSQSSQATKHTTFVNYFRSSLSDRARIPTKGIVATKANLNSKVLQEIIISLGLDYSAFELKEKLLDGELLYLRNNIAHGKGLFPSEKEFEDMYSEITGLIRELKTQIENAASRGSYCGTSHGP